MIEFIAGYFIGSLNKSIGCKLPPRLEPWSPKVMELYKKAVEDQKHLMKQL